MLKEFRMQNYKTFYKPFKLSMESQNVSELKEKLLNVNINNKEYKGLPSKIIYGGNAVGKTSIVQAMDTLLFIVKNNGIENRNVEYGNFSIYSNFSNANTYEEPIELGIDFIYKNFEYDYTIKLINNFEKHDTKISFEKLSINGDLIFTRNKDILNIQKNDSILEKYYTKNINKSFLENTEKQYNNFMLENKNIFTSYLQFAQSICIPFKEWFNICFKPFIGIKSISTQFIDLNNFDTKSNKDIQVTNQMIGKIIKLSDFGNQQLFYNIHKKEDGNYSEPILTSKYQIKNDNGKIADLTIISDFIESHGTTDLIKLYNVLNDALINGGTVIVDEMDATLNYKIVIGLLNLFYNKEINKNNAQIIFTTHNPVYLSDEVFRRDEIEFVEKDQDSLQTIGYTLNDINVRKDASYFKNFISGNYIHINSIDFESMFNNK